MASSLLIVRAALRSASARCTLSSSFSRPRVESSWRQRSSYSRMRGSISIRPARISSSLLPSVTWLLIW